MAFVCAELTERLVDELNEYKKKLLKLSAEEVLNKSYETALKDEIVCYISLNPIAKSILDKIEKEKCPLDYLYQKYMKSDSANLYCEIQNLFDEMLIA